MSNQTLKFFSIADITGVPLIVLKMDETLNENLISGFLAAIYHFGKESLRDKMATISIESPDARIESYFYDKNLKYPLIAFGFLSKTVSSDEFKKFAEAELARFVTTYGDSLGDIKSHVQEYGPFEESLQQRIQERFPPVNMGFDQKLDDIFQRISKGDLKGLDEI